MLVTATETGFFKSLRQPGEKFDYPMKKGEKMPSWMEKAAAEKPAPKSAEGESDPLD